MPRLGKVLTVLFLNIGLTLLGLAFINALSFFLLKIIPAPVDPTFAGSMEAETRYQLPVYSEPQEARRIFEEFYETETRYESFTGWRRKPYDGEFTHVNRDGERVVPSGTNKASKTVRFFGGSAVWGTGVSDAGTLPEFFARKAPAYKVRNHGETAYTSRQNLTRLVSLLNQEAPADLAVFYDGYNDVMVQCRGELGINAHLQEQKIRDALESRSPRAVLKNSFEIVFLTYTLRLAARLTADSNRQWFDKEDYYRCSDGAYARQVAETLIRNWEIAHGLVTAQGGRFLAVLQPLAYAGSPDLSHLEGRVAPPGSRMREQFETVYREIRKLIAEKEVSWMLDLTGVFDTAGRVYIDDCHVTARGNRIVAEAIHKKLS